MDNDSLEIGLRGYVGGMINNGHPGDVHAKLAYCVMDVDNAKCWSGYNASAKDIRDLLYSVIQTVGGWDEFYGTAQGSAELHNLVNEFLAQANVLVDIQTMKSDFTEMVLEF